MAGLGDHMECWELNLDPSQVGHPSLGARQMPFYFAIDPAPFGAFSQASGSFWLVNRRFFVCVGYHSTLTTLNLSAKFITMSPVLTEHSLGLESRNLGAWKSVQWLQEQGHEFKPEATTHLHWGKPDSCAVGATGALRVAEWLRLQLLWIWYNLTVYSFLLKFLKQVIKERKFVYHSPPNDPILTEVYY